jgi:RNA polymerase sigma-70 factor (ECF subfamily)
MSTGSDHSKTILLIQSGDQKAFEILYNCFADRLYNFVYSRVRIKEQAEEIVQEIFVSLWNKRADLQITDSIESYLFAAAKYKILTFIRSEHVRKKYAEEFTLFASERYDNSVEESNDLQDLELTLNEKISELPQKCQTAFRMSRMEQEPIPRIAAKMNISTRTVENYISQALKHLRTSLGELLAVVAFLFSGLID